MTRNCAWNQIAQIGISKHWNVLQTLTFFKEKKKKTMSSERDNCRHAKIASAQQLQRDLLWQRWPSEMFFGVLREIIFNPVETMLTHQALIYSWKCLIFTLY